MDPLEGLAPELAEELARVNAGMLSGPRVATPKRALFASGERSGASADERMGTTGAVCLTGRGGRSVGSAVRGV